MKFLKQDGIIEEGMPLTDEQAAEMQRVEELLHVVICQRSQHYVFQGFPKCRKVANAVAQGKPLLDALEELNPRPEPVVQQTPVAVAAEKEADSDDIPF